MAARKHTAKHDHIRWCNHLHKCCLFGLSRNRTLAVVCTASSSLIANSEWAYTVYTATLSDDGGYQAIQSHASRPANTARLFAAPTTHNHNTLAGIAATTMFTSGTH